MENIIEIVRQELRKNSDEKTRKSQQNFFKEKVKFYGVKNPEVHKISQEFSGQVMEMTKQDVFGLCEILWQSGYMEESLVACNWSYYFHRKYEPADFQTFEHWINNYVSNWASCDTFCNHNVGDFIMMYPEYISRLKDFARSSNRWMRRAAAVSLIIPAKKGLFLQDILDIAGILLLDKDDLVQKGYGWMLKEAGEAHRDVIFDFVMKNKSIMPRTALRYAIEKMPPGMKAAAMTKAAV
jgi:3-methyladenine DNA glycosylase AlkD